jgi:hypothetical protein
VDPRVARKIANCGHSGHRNSFGEPVIEHVARVSAAVPPWGERLPGCTICSS